MKCRAQVEAEVPTSPNSRALAAAIRTITFLLLVAVGSLAQDAPATQTFAISGLVKSGSTPIPGATVTATNSSTGEKTTTSTDIDGAYALQVSALGKYELRVEMPAFAPSTREIVLDNPASRADPVSYTHLTLPTILRV